MKIDYCRNLNRNYMMIRDIKKDTASFDVQMAVRAKSVCLMPVEYVMSNGETEYWYDITGKQPFESTIEVRKISYQQLADFVDQLIQVFQEVEGYLLDGNELSLRSEMIFYDPEERQFIFCYIPGYEGDNREELESLAQLMLKKIDHGDKELVSVGYQLYEKIASGSFGISDLNAFFQKQSEPETDMRQGAKSAYMTSSSQSIQQILSDEIILDDVEDEEDYLAFWEQKESSVFDKLKEKINFGKHRQDDKAHFKTASKKKRQKNSTFYDNYKPKCPIIAEKVGALQWGNKSQIPDRSSMETMYLGNFKRPDYKRLGYRGQNNREDIIVTAEEGDFFIGSNREAVDAYIDSETISRIHARIFIKDQEYYIEDLNSTNGTCLNGENIMYREKKLLHSHDRIMLADEEYEFL